MLYICPMCGAEGRERICWHHLASNEQWHISNRIWCDYFHRQIPIAKVDDFVDYFSS